MKPRKYTDAMIQSFLCDLFTVHNEIPTAVDRSSTLQFTRDYLGRVGQDLKLPNPSPFITAGHLVRNKLISGNAVEMCEFCFPLYTLVTTEETKTEEKISG